MTSTITFCDLLVNYFYKKNNFVKPINSLLCSGSKRYLKQKKIEGNLFLCMLQNNVDPHRQRVVYGVFFFFICKNTILCEQTVQDTGWMQDAGFNR